MPCFLYIFHIYSLKIFEGRRGLGAMVPSSLSGTLLSLNTGWAKKSKPA